jgi:putative RNA 2'-phosphotransferase
MEKDIRKSRFLSWVLRHEPEKIGLSLGSAGWADINELIRCASAMGVRLSHEDIHEIVRADSKGRYQLSEDSLRIRALYGHSCQVNLDFRPESPPAVLYHGTAARNLDSIMKKGIRPGRRKYVHLSSGPETAVMVGKRHGKVIVLKIDADSMYEAGIEFFKPTTEIWLTCEVPPEYISMGNGFEEQAGPK